MATEYKGGCITGITRRAGSGPRVILSHCSLAHKGAWRSLLEHLPDLDAVATDLPGHGETETDPSRAPQRQAADAVINLLETEGPAHLIGHSFGGRAVLRAALDCPDKILSLILIEPMMFHLLKDANSPEYQAEKASTDQWTDALNTGEFETAARLFTEFWGAGTAWNDIPERQQQYATARMPFLIATSEDVMGHPPGQITLEEIAALPCPIALIAGAETRPSALEIVALIARARPDSDVVHVADAGHMVPITHPQDTAKMIVAHLQRICG